MQQLSLVMVTVLRTDLIFQLSVSFPSIPNPTPYVGGPFSTSRLPFWGPSKLPMKERGTNTPSRHDCHLGDSWRREVLKARSGIFPAQGAVHRRSDTQIYIRSDFSRETVLVHLFQRMQPNILGCESSSWGCGKLLPWGNYRKLEFTYLHLSRSTLESDFAEMIKIHHVYGLIKGIAWLCKVYMLNLH